MYKVLLLQVPENDADLSSLCVKKDHPCEWVIFKSVSTLAISRQTMYIYEKQIVKGAGFVGTATVSSMCADRLKSLSVWRNQNAAGEPWSCALKDDLQVTHPKPSSYSWVSSRLICDTCVVIRAGMLLLECTEDHLSWVLHALRWIFALYLGGIQIVGRGPRWIWPISEHQITPS